MTWRLPFVVRGVLPPGVAGFWNVTDDELAAHGGAIRDDLAGYWA